MSRLPFSFRRSTPLTVLVGILAIALLTLAGGQAVADHDGAHALEGEYFWTGGNTGGELKAEFTSTGDGTWDVEFFFDFRDQPHVYTGTAEGSLTGGSLKGTVKNENKRRTFTFDGEVDETDLTFKGKHAEIRGEGERRTGTLTLGPAAGP